MITQIQEKDTRDNYKKDMKKSIFWNKNEVEWRIVTVYSEQIKKQILEKKNIEATN